MLLKSGGTSDASDDKQTLIVTIEGRSYRLNDIGSGLAQFVLVLAVAAKIQPEYILIDEPELNLHPSLQRNFLTTLAAYAKSGVIFSTHSYGLARTSAQQIYSVQRISKHESRLSSLETTPRLAELLGELSFSGYKELGFESILLVEGPNELLTFQQWLRLYKKDSKVVLLPLGGSQMIRNISDIQLNEIKRITPKISAVIDSERSSLNAELDNNRKNFVEACGKSDIPCHVLTRRALEHYLSDRAIKNEKESSIRNQKSRI